MTPDATLTPTTAIKLDLRTVLGVLLIVVSTTASATGVWYGVKSRLDSQAIEIEMLHKTLGDMQAAQRGIQATQISLDRHLLELTTTLRVKGVVQ
jgi:hypothetical protein